MSRGAGEELARVRLDFARRWRDLHDEIAREVGRAPRSRRWALPLAAAAAGLALAWKLKARSRRSLED